MLPRFLLLVLVAFLLGCASPYKRMNVINIDPRFSEYEQHMIVEAATTWFNKTDQEELPIYITHKRKGGAIFPVYSTTGSCKAPRLGFTRLNPTAAPRIGLCMNRIGENPDLFYAIALHEFGHAFARRSDHLEQSGRIMSPGLDRHTPPYELSRKDKDYVNDVIAP